MKKLIKGVNDFASQYPESAAFWDYEENDRFPDEFTCGSGYKAHFVCPKNNKHKWENSIREIIKLAGKECPFCNLRCASPGVNDLKTLYPEICEEWDYEKNERRPEEYLPSSNKSVYWKCKKGHGWPAIIESRTKGGNNCPYCGNKKCLKGFNDLETNYPEIAKEWNYEKNGDVRPDEVLMGTNKKYHWKCSKEDCGYEWPAAVNSRTIKGCGCPACAGIILVPGKNDLLTLRPDLAKELNTELSGGITAGQLAAQSNRIVFWNCPKDHHYKAKVSTRFNNKNGGGCPYCNGKKILVGFNDLQTVNPELAAEWHPTKNGKLTPQMITANSNKKVWWKGTCGCEWEAAVYSRNKGSGCPNCMKKVAGSKDIQ